MNSTRIIEPVWNCIDAAHFLRLHAKTVKRLARLGQIPGRQIGRRWFFRPSDLDGMLRGGVDFSAKATKGAPQFSS
jgi:hypothetical protein